MPTTEKASTPMSERLFRALLRLLPGEFRDRFSDEMQSLFHEQRQDAQQGGRAAHFRFWWDTALGLVSTAIREHGEILSQDVDYALRLMRKDLAFTLVAIVILGLAIGASTAAFSAANAILIRPLPFSVGNNLVQLKQLQPANGIDNMPFSVQEIDDYRARNHSFDSLVEYHEMMFSLLGGREPERVETAVVSANFFRVLGVTPLFGRTFMDEDDRPSARPVLILSYQFWQRSFGGDPNVVGRTYTMNDKQHVVVGVLPAIPQFPGVVDVYMPTAACPFRSDPKFVSSRSSRMMSAFATLKPGVSLAQAEKDLRGIAQQLKTAHPEAYPAAAGYDIAVKSVHEQLTTDIRPVLIALAAAALLLLLLACSNIAGLMLSRILARSRELTVRSALGASRSRIVRSFITEGMLLAFVGGALGLLLAFWSIDILVPFTSKFTTLATELRMGPEVIAFCFVVSLVCGAVIGFVPAIGLHQTPLFTAQLDNANTPTRISSRARGLLVAAQLALSVVLLVGAGLTLRTLFELEHSDGGFRAGGVTTARIILLKHNIREFYDALLKRTGRLSGVQSVALSSTFPLYSRVDDQEYAIETDGQGPSQAQPRLPVSGRAVTPGYFGTIGMPIVSGRDFSAEDDEHHPIAIIVNQRLANRLWPGIGALGKTIVFSPQERGTVVGVVGDVRQKGLDREPEDEAYCAFAQTRRQSMSLLVRGSRSASEISPEISWIVHDLDPEAVITDVQALAQVREDSLAPRRTTAIFLGVFAALALAITASGISGLMALEVGERKHEIGIRMALGATPGRVMGAMMTRVLVIVVAGLGCGFAAAWLMSASMSRLIYGIVPRDSLTFGASSALLLVIAVMSSFIPLTRIARLDPTVLLRAE